VLLAHPIGKICAMILPYTTYKLPRWLGGLTFSLNPGPWNVKEHTLLYLIGNVSSVPPFINAMFVVQEKYYGVRNGIWYEILMILSCDVTGLGLAGLCRALVVKPASMIWPDTLVTCVLMNTLHAEEERETRRISRPKFFLYILLGSFVYYFFPGMRLYLEEEQRAHSLFSTGFIFTALSMFSWVCWIWPESVTINQLFGISSGLGMGILTFDWAQISLIANPLMIPWWAQANIFVSFVVTQWIVVPILYYTNVSDLTPFLVRTLPTPHLGVELRTFPNQWEWRV
jgi:OPT family oligopeptide transporter